MLYQAQRLKPWQLTMHSTRATDEIELQSNIYAASSKTNKLAYHFFGRATAIITIDTLYRKNLLHQLVQHF
jgi:hypothetical protein